MHLSHIWKRPLRLSLAFTLSLAIAATLTRGAAAQQPPPPALLSDGSSWQEGALSEAYSGSSSLTSTDAFTGWLEEGGEVVQAQRRTACGDLRFNDIEASDLELILTDADLIAESDSTRFCLLLDLRWDTYAVWLLNVGSVEEFRRTKAQAQTLLIDAGVDPCRVGFWDAFSSPARRRITPDDRVDAGVPCAPEIITHGPQSERRAEEMRHSLAASVAAAEQAYGWTLTWPLRVHLYDDHDAFVEGIRHDAGDQRGSNRSLERTFGTTGFIASGMMGFLVDTSNFPTADDLRMLAAHEFAHVAQWGALGCPCVLPFFAIEGGAEYFAGLVVGHDQPFLAGRFRRAQADERGGNPVPLRELITRPERSDERRTLAAYSRGYAAMRFLTTRWGLDAFTRLHVDSVDGGPDAFIAGMETLTGLSLDEFDRQLSAFLLGQPAALAPSPSATITSVSRATLAPGSQLLDLVTARRSGDRLGEASRFTASDALVSVRAQWKCLPRAIQGEGRVIAPDGQLFTSFSGSDGPGCDVANGFDFSFDRPYGGRVARSLPGLWRVEIYADRVLQGSVTFSLE